MCCSISQGVPASQWVDFSASDGNVLSCCSLPLQYQHSDYDDDLVLLRNAQICFSLQFQVRRRFFPFWFLFCVARFSKASMKDDTKSRGLGLRRKMGCLNKLEDIAAENGICLPIPVAVLVSLESSSSAQIDSKSKIAMSSKRFWLSVWSMPNVNFVKQGLTQMRHVL